MKFNKIILGVLFAIGIALIILVMPTEKKFRFEFQKGQKWMHEDLYAPFDFSIYKSQEDLKNEKDSVESEIVDFYLYDAEILNVKKEELVTRFYKEKNKDKNEDDRYSIGSESVPGIEYLKAGLDFMTDVYSNGIIDLSEVESSNLKQNITILQGKVAETKQISNLVTIEEVETQIQKFYKKFCSHKSDSGIFILDSIQFAELFVPNVIYDDETTESMRANIFASLSLTRGKINSGELIISTGDYVNTEKHAILSSLKREINSRTLNTYSFYMILGGQIVLVFLSFFALVLLIYYSQPEILSHHRQALFIIMVVVMFVALASVSARYYAISIYLIPFAMIPVIIKAFFNERIALFTHIITILIAAFNAPNSFEFVFLQTIVGVIILFSLGNSYRRSYLFLSSIVSFIAYSAIYFGIAVMQEGELSKIYWMQFAWFGASSLLLLTTYPLIFVFEKVFGFLSDMTLIELSDTNSPLLRELAEKAPGTFQHTLQVANLAEAAAREVGANTLLARVGALYHDIGKLNRPLFFTENQMNQVNPHDELNPEESAAIIIGHVTEGVKMSRKHNLPEQIASFIKGHHGTTKVQYFIAKQKEVNPDGAVEEAKFTYPIEKPQLKEVAIMMMADVVEAASRSLTKYDEKSISELIDRLISSKIDERQFDDVDLSFRDITRIKKLFTAKLVNIYHSRIAYPDQKK